MQALLSLALCCATVATARTLSPAAAPSAGVTLSTSFKPASPGQSCSDVCAGSPLVFASAEGASSLCAFTSSGLQVGYESSTRPGTCISSTGESTSYSCTCLAAGQQGGLALLQAGDATCDASCAVGIDGSVGTGVTLVTGDSRRVCLAHSDIGGTYRFAPTVPGSSSRATACNTGASLLSTGFSCVCQYSVAPAPALALPTTEPRVTAQSVGTLG